MPWQTAVVLLGGVQLLSLAAALCLVERNRVANRMLGAWLMVAAGLLTPFALAYAGLYVRLPWLAFAPFAVPLAIGPLAWGYVRALTEGRAPPRFWAHLAAPLAQFAYTLLCFLQPVAAKSWWSDHIHERWVSPALGIVSLVSLGGYSLAAMRHLRRYRRALAMIRGDDERFAAAWLNRALGALLAILALRLLYQGAEAFVGRAPYDAVFSFYLLFGAIALYLAIEGWRHALLPYPREEATPAPAPGGHDWVALGQAWADQVRAAGWWREPELDLTTLAARLGTNRSYLSRALNEGLGTTFSAFINGLRSQAVAERLRAGQGGDLLILALDCGFSSKASFNRAFRAAFGQGPAEYRRRHASDRQKMEKPAG